MMKDTGVADMKDQNRFLAFALGGALLLGSGALLVYKGRKSLLLTRLANPLLVLLLPTLIETGIAFFLSSKSKGDIFKESSETSSLSVH